MAAKLYALEFSYYSLAGTLKSPSSLLLYMPANLSQLNLYLQALLHAHLQGTAVPATAHRLLGAGDVSHLMRDAPLEAIAKMQYKLSLVGWLIGVEGPGQEGMLRGFEAASLISCACCSLSDVEGARRQKIAAINQELSHFCPFINEGVIAKVAENIAARVDNTKSLPSFSCDELVDFLAANVVRLHLHKPEVRKFMIINSKKQQLLRFSTLEVGKSTSPQPRQTAQISDDPSLVDLVLGLAQKFGQAKLYVEIFQPIIGHLGKLFEAVKQEGKQLEFPHLVKFMMGNTTAKTLPLFKNLYIPRNAILSCRTLPQLLELKNSEVFVRLHSGPEHTAQACVEFYLEKSGIRIPSRLRQRTYADPLSVIGVVRQFWDDPFHGGVINWCIWALLGRLFRLAESKARPGVDIRVYRRNVVMALIHVAMGYRIGTFVSFYPTESNTLGDLFSLESLPTLLLNCPDYLAIPWVQILTNHELINMLRFPNGYRLVSEILESRPSNIEQIYGNKILVAMETDCMRMRGHAMWKQRSSYALKIAEYFAALRSTALQAEKFKNLLERTV